MKNTRQVAALPFRRSKSGGLEVLLVTSRETQRWVIPKGWPWPQLADHLAAAEEAREEAGVRGTAMAEPIGTFGYDKRIKNGSKPLLVDVFLLEVTQQLDKWPERKQRTRTWFKPEAAAEAVAEPELKALLLGLDATLAGRLRTVARLATPAARSRSQPAAKARAGRPALRKVTSGR
jgi:8-oxo-dGTP pyrophosphatase MutT (NUDIX family)